MGTTTNPKAPGQDVATNVGTVNLTGVKPGSGRIWPDRSTTQQVRLIRVFRGPDF